MTNGSAANILFEEGVAVITFNLVTMPAGPELEEIAKQIAELIDKQKPYGTVVDFTGVKFFSSQTLGIILEARKKAADYNGSVVISGINPQLYRVFKITNLDKIFKFFPQVGEAIEYLKKHKEN